MSFGVIFDFNGVIIDDYPIQKEAWDTISMILRGKKCTDEEMLKNIRGIPTLNSINWLSPTKLPVNQQEEMARQKHLLVENLYLNSSLFRLNNGFVKFCDELRNEKIPMTIATSATFQTMKFAFEKLGLNIWFALDKIIYSDGSYPGKPAPDVYLLAAKLLRLDPAQCVVFEDAISGITAARNAGVGVIIAVGSDERLEKLLKVRGIDLGINDFTQTSILKLRKLINIK